MDDVTGGMAAPGLNFDLPEEIRMLKETVRKFVDREMIPIERQTRDGHKLKPEMRAHLHAKAKELGLANYDVPREYGGLGLGLVAKVTVWAELARSIALPSRGVDIFGPNVSPILYHLDEEQKTEIPAADHPRRAQLVPGANRARRRRRSRQHAHDRRAAGRPLRDQRHEALHHRRRRGRFHAS